MLTSLNTTYYYISDYIAFKIYMFDDNWTFIASKSYNSPLYMITVDSNLYISSDTNVYKTDEILNLVSQYNASGLVYYRGLYLDSSRGVIYIVANHLGVIQIFDLNLLMNDSISIPYPYIAYSITGYNNQIYVGTESGTILVLVNKIITSTFNACNRYGLVIASIVFDQYG